MTAEVRTLLGDLSQELAAVEPWGAEATERAVRAFAERLGLKLGAVAQPLRAAVTGRTTSPGIFDVLEVLGPDRKSRAARRSIRRKLAVMASFPHLAVHT